MKISKEILMEVIQEVFPWVDEKSDDIVLAGIEKVVTRYCEKHQEYIQKRKAASNGSDDTAGNRA